MVNSFGIEAENFKNVVEINLHFNKKIVDCKIEEFQVLVVQNVALLNIIIGDLQDDTLNLWWDVNEIVDKIKVVQERQVADKTID